MADDDERKAKHKESFSKWVSSPRAASNAAAEKRQGLFEALNEYIRANGGWITSVPGVRDLRIEIPRGSALVNKLADLGYVMRCIGSSTRLTTGGHQEVVTEHSTGLPFTISHAGFVPVDVYETSISK
jgi:hypothetical protein